MIKSLREKLRRHKGLTAGAMTGYSIGALIERTFPVNPLPFVPRAAGLALGAFFGVAIQWAVADVRNELAPAPPKRRKTRRR
jgi:hypothetical protein